MATDEKTRLVQLLEETRRDTLIALEGVDDEMVVDPESGWRVKDIIGHLAAWDIEAVTALRAYGRGEVYLIPNYTTMDDFNARHIEKRKALLADQIRAEWETAHHDLKIALQEIPLDRFVVRMAYPWGGHGAISELVEIMAEHEREHCEDIAKAVRSGSGL